VRVGLSAYRVGVPHDVVEHVPAVVDRCGQGSPRGEQAVLHGDDHRGQARGEVAVHPVALHRGAHEPAAVHVENQRKVVSPGGRGSVHPDAHHRLDGGECERCRYVGWAASAELSEASRGRLRARPLERRRLYVA